MSKLKKKDKHEEVVQSINYLDRKEQKAISISKVLPIRMSAEKCNHTVILLIAGPTCSGKSTLAELVKKQFEHIEWVSEIICQDNYLKNRNELIKTTSGYLMDSLFSFHIEEFISDVVTLLTRGKVNMPRYDKRTNSRISKDFQVKRNNIIIIEGVHVIEIFKNLLYKKNNVIKQLYGKEIHEEIFRIFDNALTIYVDDPIEECMKRRTERDDRKYATAPYKTQKYFRDCIIPQYEKDILPQRSKAQLIV